MFLLWFIFNHHLYYLHFNFIIFWFLKQHKGKITTDNSNIDIFVIPTDEEYMILKDTYNKCNLVKEKKAKTYTKTQH